MTWFLLKGLLRDRSRSLFPLLVTAAGVLLTVFMYSFIEGEMADMVTNNANYQTGHVKVVTRAYAEQMERTPNDLALLEVEELQNELSNQFPEIEWAPRIHFGGLLDIPDETGETRAQGPAGGLAVDLLNPSSDEIQRMGLRDGLVQGRLPEEPFEILVSDEFAQSLDLEIGQSATLISTGMYGGMAMQNFEVVGTVHFGIQALDRGGIIADISGIRRTLNMDDGAGELLGFFKDGQYEEERADAVVQKFEQLYSSLEGDFTPAILKLTDQNDLGSMYAYVDVVSSIMVFIFVLVMSIVLWNAGLMGTLRRYGEYGVRLAIGEEKSHIYRTMIIESVMIGLVGSVVGTALGLAASYYMQSHGIDVGNLMGSATILFPDVVRAKVTTASYYVGFFPGLLATTLGSMIAGLGIYKRETATLFKELEVQ
ncbi:MAG: FtsX-like permease family protein [Candidatus Marinimicrobia bacterium]|nr:FtsX-like permease family protein [Candidatus Neomarinimicrobiota bacterium]MCF7830312.1 FtsX-like permease family protein [Candidatus Neomarinimicrobiota bacterium]MCF7882289.1 FtsX-like permease family protein [Candidatus Neomarinimicrobiota bacterium]